MRKSLYMTGAFFCISLIVAVVSLAAGNGKPTPIKALVYHETTGFRHASIPYAIEQITSWGRHRRIEVTADQTSSRFTDEGLAPFDVVVWLSTVGRRPG